MTHISDIQAASVKVKELAGSIDALDDFLSKLRVRGFTFQDSYLVIERGLDLSGSEACAVLIRSAWHDQIHALDSFNEESWNQIK